MSGWAAIALENQALLTKALENLAAAERERDTARDLAVSLENLVHEARADAERVRAELVETAARGLALEVGAPKDASRAAEFSGLGDTQHGLISRTFADPICQYGGCTNPTVDYVNLAIAAASSVPSSSEARCAEHGGNSWSLAARARPE